MGQATSTIEEVRFILRDEQMIEVYVYSRAGGDAPLGVQGWHYQVFPARIPVIDIMTQHIADYLLWPLHSPEPGRCAVCGHDWSDHSRFGCYAERLGVFCSCLERAGTEPSATPPIAPAPPLAPIQCEACDGTGSLHGKDEQGRVFGVSCRRCNGSGHTYTAEDYAKLEAQAEREASEYEDDGGYNGDDY